MKILFTGASSFTGFWFIRELSQQGHDVTAIFRRQPEKYPPLRHCRVAQLKAFCTPVYECSFGDAKFRELIESESHWDLLCHHAADVTNYKTPNFDFGSAIINNTKNIQEVLELLKNRGCHRVLLTGSVFEQNEGAGSLPHRAFSPYGLSKGLTAQVFEYFCLQASINLGKFVIPNPFGPFEEQRFTSFLIDQWMQNEVPSVKTPAYVRDNIHVSLLAKGYAHFANHPTQQTFHPSGYVESQGAFTERFAKEMRHRLNLPCEFQLEKQVAFHEPRVRINTQPLTDYPLDWDETSAWDNLAEYYQACQTESHVK